MALVNTTNWFTGNMSMHMDLVRSNYNQTAKAKFSKIIRFLAE